MSDEGDKVALTAEQRLALEQAAEWERDALVELGKAYLRHDEAKREIERSARQLRSAEQRAREAGGQNKTILEAIATTLNLPSGSWVYDPTAGILRKEGG